MELLDTNYLEKLQDTDAENRWTDSQSVQKKLIQHQSSGILHAEFAEVKCACNVCDYSISKMKPTYTIPEMSLKINEHMNVDNKI